jgi:hypothetical protein
MANFCIHRIKVDQKPFATQAQRLPLFSSVSSCLGGLKNVQPILDQYKNGEIHLKVGIN